ncbi:DUF2334 domain-containing protein [Methylocystis sp. JAN1]|uniref:DUF2334 domain-containing protein n=1 Tax=Methylocystis sp. JAN1 TaxID=3397211 RepID=UPI003FA278CC
MSSSFLFTRRKLLAGAAVTLLPSGASASPSRAVMKREVPKHAIFPNRDNPFFKPLGAPLREKRPKAQPFQGDGASGSAARPQAAAALPAAGGAASPQAAAAFPASGSSASPQAAAALPASGSAAARQAAALPASGSATGPQAAAALPAAGGAVAPAADPLTPLQPVRPTASTLVLYDTTGPYGWLGELYAIMAGNLASHFGAWTAMPVTSYAAGGMSGYTSVVYIGSTYDEPLPAAFLDDAYAATTQKIIWISYNIWQLIGRNPGFLSKYGWGISSFDFSNVAEIDYKSQKLKRYAANQSGIMNYSTFGPGQALAYCVRSDNSTFPWALRSQNLTYIGEIPFSYVTEGDRYLIFCDLLFDALAPDTPTMHRAFLRLEDIDPYLFSPTELVSVAQWLSSNNVPFGFQIVPRYLDPNGYFNGGKPVDVSLSSRPEMIAAIKTMQSLGGVLMGHGYTHQYSNVENPYSATTGADCEFYRLVLNQATNTLNYVGPVPEDATPAWALGRFSAAANEFAASGLTAPTIHTFPCYVAAVQASNAASKYFAARSERALYFSGLISGGAIDYTRLAGQYFPYTVKDVYCSLMHSNCKVLPDTLGGIEPQAFGVNPPRLPADIIADAQRLLVVRDGVASFFHHPEQPISYLQEVVRGLLALGYQFVSPAAV